MGNFCGFLSKKLCFLRKKRERRPEAFHEWCEKTKLTPEVARVVDPAEDYQPNPNEEVLSVYYDGERIVQLVLTHKEEAQPGVPFPHHEADSHHQRS